MEIFTTKTLSQYIDRSPAAIRNMVMRRDIPYRKVSGVLTFIRQEIDSWIETAPGLTMDEWRTKNGNEKKTVVAKRKS